LTRLKVADLQHIPRTMEKYDRELLRKTGCTLLEIAQDAAQTDANIKTILKKTKAAVVAITSGGGVIGGFSDAVAAILNHVGVRTMLTKGSDVVGLAEAYEQHADLIFAADDTKFVAVNVHTVRVVDNAISTAKAYVAALDKMAKGLKGKTVLVIGLGNVGSRAVANLISRKAKPLAVDNDRVKLRALSTKYRGNVVAFNTVAEAIRHTNLIINTAPARNILKADMMRENMLISAPAIPHGLTPAAVKRIGKHNLIHDPLQLGVATMAVEACAN
jgi:pyrrolysine biosynthesis protein PylD